MDSTILNGVVMILERIPLHIIMMAILEKPEFKNSIARTAIIQNTRALAHLLFKNPDTVTQLAMQDIAFEACIQESHVRDYDDGKEGEWLALQCQECIT